MANIEMLRDNIGVWHNALPDWYCEDMVEMTDKYIAEAEKTYDPDDPEHKNHHKNIMFRNNNKRVDSSLVMGHFNEMYPYEEHLKKVLELSLEEYYHEVANQYANHSGTWRLVEEIECKVQRTPPNGGFCQWHYEQGPDYFCSRRFGVWMLYLNDVNDGGKTDFPNQDLSVKPEAGKLVIWPAAFTHIHRSAPDLREWKYIVTGWFIYKDAEDKQNKARFEKSRVGKSSS